MKVRLLGLVWTLGNGISFDDLFEHLAKLHGKPKKMGFYERLLYVGKKGDYHVGLFLTVKDQRKTCEILKEEGNYKVSVRTLERGRSLVDFNFFAIHSETGRGLYQHYHNSCSLNQFSNFCQREYDSLKDALIEAMVKKGRRSTEDKMAAAKAYEGDLEYQIMIRHEALQKMLNSLARIRAFEFDYVTLVAKVPHFEPFDGTLRREQHTISFDTKIDARKISRKIVAVVKSLGLDRGRITGNNAEGAEEIVNLIMNPDSFGDYEYEELADEATLNLSKIEDSPFIATMLANINDQKIHFEGKAK